MPVIKKIKPSSPGRRHYRPVSLEGLDKKKPEKSLTSGKKRVSGRNNNGRVTTRHKGGGHKRKYRVIDFLRNKDGVPGKVEAIEYDPNRNCHIALICYRDGERRYIIAADGLNKGDVVTSGPDAEINTGCSLPIRNIPLGTFIHAIEIRPGKGAQMVRSAGAAAQLVAKEGRMAQVKLASGEVRFIPMECRATIGTVGNAIYSSSEKGKAGRNRWKGKRPSVRGVAMNPVDHPHGGGEGRSSGGRHPSTPWGFPTKGYKTRKVRKPSDKFIVSRRK